MPFHRLAVGSSRGFGVAFEARRTRGFHQTWQVAAQWSLRLPSHPSLLPAGPQGLSYQEAVCRFLRIDTQMPPTPSPHLRSADAGAETSSLDRNREIPFASLELRSLECPSSVTPIRCLLPPRFDKSNLGFGSEPTMIPTSRSTLVVSHHPGGLLQQLGPECIAIRYRKGFAAFPWHNDPCDSKATRDRRTWSPQHTHPSKKLPRHQPRPRHRDLCALVPFIQNLASKDQVSRVSTATATSSPKCRCCEALV